MRQLRNQEPMMIYDEERHHLIEALEDIRYARNLLNRLGPQQRARFSEMGWAYGDPTYMYGNIDEVFDAQLATVLHTLFATPRFTDEAGNGLRGEVIHAYVGYDGEEEVLDHLAGLDGGPVEPETIVAVWPNTIAGRLTSGPLRQLRTEPAGSLEDLLAVEISGDRECIADLTRLLRTGCGEGRAPRLYRWKEGSLQARQLSPRDAVVMLFGIELCDMRDIIHDTLFERLIGAWRHAA